MRSATGYEGGNSPSVASPLVGPQTVANATPPSLPDPLALPKLVIRVEKLLKESRRPTAGEQRLDEISGELRSIVPGLTGEIVSARRRAATETLRKLYHPRYHRFCRQRTYTEFFAGVVNARLLAGEFQNARTRDALFAKAQSIIEIFKAEVQSEASRIS